MDAVINKNAIDQAYIEPGELSFKQDRQIISIFMREELIGVLAINKPIESKGGLVSLAWIISQMMGGGKSVKD